MRPTTLEPLTLAWNLTIKSQFIVETERLRLEKFTLLDAPFVLELLNDPSYIENIRDAGVRNLAEAEKFIVERYWPSYEQHGFGFYIVKLKSTGEALGMCGLIKRDFLEDVDIGFAFLERFRGQGYAVESSLAVRDFAKDKLKLKRLIGVTLPSNKASAKVLEAIGMTFEKMIVFKTDGKDTRLFGMSFK